MIKYRVSAVVALVLTGAALVTALSAQANLRTTYKHRYAELVDRHGVKTAGCNLITNRYHNRCHGKTTTRDIRRSVATLKRMLTVPKPVTPAVHYGSTTPATPVPSATGGLPSCTWAPESGGDYGAYNSSSGARGKYQVIPSTHDAYCSDLGWSSGEQEECAARIYAGQGAGAWVNC